MDRKLIRAEKGKPQNDRQTILVVDDSRSTLLLLKAILQEEHRVLTASNGWDALQIGQCEKVDLILLDVVMPDMDGYETCRQLKNNTVTQNIPVIFVTSLGEVEDETRGLRLGAIDYVVKPIRVPILKARVRNHLDLKKYRDSLENLCMIDCLTGIPNRRYFETSIEKEWRRSLRSHTSLSLFYIDIDFFKEYNDRFGHPAGDSCLRQVAAALEKTAKRAGDAVFRCGGEEFVAIAPALSTDGAAALGELLCTCVRNTSPVTISIGIATTFPNKGVSPESLLAQADIALLMAKRTGKNKIVSYMADQMANAIVS